ncbi:unnamed protein product [Phaeothamnion confervicola]
MRVVQVFAESRTPLHRMPYFQPLLEVLSGLQLTDISELRCMVPDLLKIEENQLFEELTGKKVAIVFDGTTRTREVFAVVARFMDADGSVQERLIDQPFLCARPSTRQPSMPATSRGSLPSRNGTSNTMLSSPFVSDRCATNLAAIGALKPFYRSVMMIGCESHTFDNCGKKIVDAKVVDQYPADFVGLVGYSHKMREYLKVEVGSAPPTYCRTRCGSWTTGTGLASPSSRPSPRTSPRALISPDWPNFTASRSPDQRSTGPTAASRAWASWRSRNRLWRPRTSWNRMDRCRSSLSK